MHVNYHEYTALNKTQDTFYQLRATVIMSGVKKAASNRQTKDNRRYKMKTRLTQLNNLFANRLQKEHMMRIVLMISSGSEAWQQFGNIIDTWRNA